MDLTENLNLIGYSMTERKQLKSIDEVAEFICKQGKHGDVTIKNNGEPFITTIGIYLDKVADIRYRAQLMPILTKKQEQIFTELDADERRTVAFGDECQIVIPNGEIDCSRLGYFDELESDCWNLVKQYCATLGIEILPNEDGEEPIDFYIAKGIQDKILEELQNAGAKFKFESNMEVNEQEKNIQSM